VSQNPSGTFFPFLPPLSIPSTRAMPSIFKIDPPPYSPLGDTVPALTPHAVSVSLPTWQDVVDYEEGEQRIKDAMTSGYPRFFIHHQIQKVSFPSLSNFDFAIACEIERSTFSILSDKLTCNMIYTAR